jgi:hypothetical protein
MPWNRFPESAEKRELRRRDGLLIEKLAAKLGRPLDYCGMPSVEFRDVESWRSHLRSVTAIEYNHDVAEDMRIEKDRRGYPFPVSIHDKDVLDFLLETQDVYDVYNLDCYGGFLHPKKGGGARHVEALRALFSRHARGRHEFILITTFNVRESGAQEYLQFLNTVAAELGSYRNCKSNIKAHQHSQLHRMQLCFPVFCWQQAQAHGMNYVCEAIHCYRTTVQLIHFNQSFSVSESLLPKISYNKTLIELANRPLVEMRRQVPTVLQDYPQIGN